MKLLYIILCTFAFSILPSSAQEEHRILGQDIFQNRLELAKRLNSQGHYVQAFDSLRSLHQDVVRTISLHGVTPATVSDTKDFIFYQNVLTSEAECAYMNNFWKEMESICTELAQAINERYKEDLGQNKDYLFQIGSFFKVRGDYHYIKGASNHLMYDNAREDYENAIYFFDQAYDNQAKSKTYAELAQLEYTLGNYEEALDYIEQAVNDNNNRLAAGANAHESFSNAENFSLDITYQSALAMCQARNYSFRKALNTIDGIIAKLPKKDTRIPELKRRKAKILLLQHEAYGTDIDDASSLYETYFNSIKVFVNNNFMQMTADQREEYWMLQQPFIADCYQLEDLNPELLYNVTLYNKGILLQTAHAFEDLLYDGNKKNHRNERKLLNEKRQQDAENALTGKTTTLAEDYEKELLQTMNADGRRKKFFAPLDRVWKDVQKALPEDGCAIEFVEYEKQQAMHFGALVLKKTGKPRFIHICNADELADYFPGDSYFTLRTLLASSDGSAKNDIYEDELLRNYIWTKDLIDVIGNSQKLYFSADGYLHQLAIEYMLPERLQSKKLYRLSSTRVLAEGKKIDPKKVKNGAAFILGGIVYNSYFDNENHTDPGNDAKAFRMLQEMGASFSNMKGAKDECDSIVFYRDNPNDLYLDSLKASEHAFYEHCRNYPILHLSTHGYFGGDKIIYKELLASSTKDVLSESVLALSNAGTHLRDDQFDVFNKDGILSAREVARLNLENVELVTTSACQTGLGYITADGIYGMQRGFKSAGVKGMIMTLWSVNIESARIFFTDFYRLMAEGKSVHTAFSQAHNNLQTKNYTIALTKKFNTSTLSNKDTDIIINLKYDKPQHTCPYLLIDVWE